MIGRQWTWDQAWLGMGREWMGDEAKEIQLLVLKNPKHSSLWPWRRQDTLPSQWLLFCLPNRPPPGPGHAHLVNTDPF